MRSITKYDLTQTLSVLNRLSGIAQPGHDTPGSWQIGWAYGGCQLERVANTGGVHSFGGFGTKRETLSRMLAMIDGVRELSFPEVTALSPGEVNPSPGEVTESSGGAARPLQLSGGGSTRRLSRVPNNDG